jgi:hypothetical protein
MEAIMKEINEENMLAVRALGFALLLCTSEEEALLVMRYFTSPKPGISVTPEPDDQPDGFGKN